MSPMPCRKTTGQGISECSVSLRLSVDRSILANENILIAKRDLCWNEKAISKEIFTKGAAYAQTLLTFRAI